ncbi:MAG: TIGR03905 family TSCPD domain-containing protein [Clostridia bacterium]|nr:TIGR03905 family TSCPD domain-containing protein [Clostridia bacterium]
MEFSYKTNGVCSRTIHIEVQDGIVKKVRFDGGCNGNTKGIGSLVEGMPVDEVITRLKGIKCGFKGTSCPDQLATALEEMKKG